jgi:hypothetical protein
MRDGHDHMALIFGLAWNRIWCRLPLGAEPKTFVAPSRLRLGSVPVAASAHPQIPRGRSQRKSITTFGESAEWFSAASTASTIDSAG